MPRCIALLRAVNVGGRKVPMAALRSLCAGLGWRDVETFIQSGNIVFGAKGTHRALETALEKALVAEFGFEVPAIVRSAAEWKAILASNPFESESEKEPNWVLLGLGKDAIADGAAEAIEGKAKAGEQVRAAGGALWFHYSRGVGTSKLTPALIDRAAGTAVTARNWRTALALKDMLSE